MSWELDRLTTEALGALLDAGRPAVALLPVGSVEPHGPHMALATDTVISRAACERACALLEQRGLQPLIAPAIPYGVTECARAFRGAVSVAPAALTAFVRSAVDGLLATGFAHVCVVNNHLEPAQDAAIRAAVEGRRASAACPLTRRWARTLSAEFKSGQCHAGRYETSIVMAAAPDLIDEPTRATLPEVPVSLSDNLRAGIDEFTAMGMSRAYAGAPAAASPAEGHTQLDLLAEMITTEILEALP